MEAPKVLNTVDELPGGKEESNLGGKPVTSMAFKRSRTWKDTGDDNFDSRSSELNNNHRYTAFKKTESH